MEGLRHCLISRWYLWCLYHGLGLKGYCLSLCSWSYAYVLVSSLSKSGTSLLWQAVCHVDNNNNNNNNYCTDIGYRGCGGFWLRPSEQLGFEMSRCGDLCCRYLDRIIRSSELRDFSEMLQLHQKALTADGQLPMSVNTSVISSAARVD